MRPNSTWWTGPLLLTLLTAWPAFGAENSCPLPPISLPTLHYDRLYIPEIEGAGESDTSIFADLRAPEFPSAASVAGPPAKTLGAAVRFETASPFTPYLSATIGPPATEATHAGKPDSAPPENLKPPSAYLLSAGVACDLDRGAQLNLGYRYATGSLPELANPLGLASDQAGDDHHLSVGLKLAF